MPEVYHYLGPDTTGADLSEYYRLRTGREPAPGSRMTLNTVMSRFKRDLVTLEYDDCEDDQWNYVDNEA